MKAKPLQARGAGVGGKAQHETAAADSHRGVSSAVLAAGAWNPKQAMFPIVCLDGEVELTNKLQWMSTCGRRGQG